MNELTNSGWPPGRARLPELSPERARLETLVECFVATEGLGPSRLRTLARSSSLPLAATLERLASGGDAPARGNRRQTPWHELVARFGEAVRDAGGARARWWIHGDPGFHELFPGDEPPVALSVLGSLDVLHAPRAAIVGTRSASSAGIAFARQLAGDLAEAGVSVVSGLARGIDGAAHRGALGSCRAGSGPVGVLGTGVHVAYPSEHRELQSRVSEAGLLVSEFDALRGPRQEAFPLRNRIVAHLAQVVVVIESGHRGGSLLTVNEAVLRGRPVLAVPNNPLVRSAVGTNELLRAVDGAPPLALPCHSAADVLAVLDVEHVMSDEFVELRPTPSGVEAAVLNALGWDQRTTAALASATSRPLAEVVRALVVLEDVGWVEHRHGRWMRRPR